jgi:hypothetical protein
MRLAGIHARVGVWRKPQIADLVLLAESKERIAPLRVRRVVPDGEHMRVLQILLNETDLVSDDRHIIERNGHKVDLVALRQGQGPAIQCHDAVLPRMHEPIVSDPIGL